MLARYRGFWASGCNAIQELQTNIASSANFESDDDNDEGQNC